MINEAMLEMLDGRYELATEIRLEVPLHVSVETAGLIRAGVSKNTLKAYRHASKKLESWLAERGGDVMARAASDLSGKGMLEFISGTAHMNESELMTVVVETCFPGSVSPL